MLFPSRIQIPFLVPMVHTANFLDYVMSLSVSSVPREITVTPRILKNNQLQSL